jgi:hypothetical protein
MFSAFTVTLGWEVEVYFGKEGIYNFVRAIAHLA